MTGWGRVPFFLAVGLFVAAGCGGRTSALYDGYDPDGSGADGSGGNSSGGVGVVAGRPGRAGSATAGAVGVGGASPAGGFTAAGAAYGGAPVGGSFPSGGTGIAGALTMGGAFPVGGTFNGFGGTGPNPGGDCCEAQAGPRCRPNAVAKCVCGAGLNYCCDKVWDQGCADAVQKLGCGSCEPFDCQSCLNQSCNKELSQCFQDFGCLSIFSCMQNAGCEAFQCYSEQYCRGVIDQWGGPAGDSMARLLRAFTCSFSSGCPCN